MPTSNVHTFPMEPIIPETRFPSLDTAYRSPTNASLQDAQCNGYSDNHGAKIDYKTLAKPILSGEWPLEHSTIYESYSEFVVAFTGRDEIAFRASHYLYRADLPRTKSGRRGIVHANSVEGSATGGETQISVTWEFVKDSSGAASTLDFGIEIIDAEKQYDPIESSQARDLFTILIYTENEFIRNFALRYDPNILSDVDAPHFFDRAFSYLRRLPSSDEETPADYSILNFPPLMRPPRFREDDAKETGYNAAALLHSAFERRVLQFPNRLALDFLESQTSASEHPIRRTFTYTELSELTTSLAEYILISLGTEDKTSSTVVPILLSTSAELYISYLAVLKAGLAFCPLPIDAPTQRLQDICDDLSPRVIIGSEMYRHKLPDFSLDTQRSRSPKWLDVENFIRLRTKEGIICEGQISCRVLAQPQESDVAYIMYTSGSTGKPKGVQITHLAATCSISAHATSSTLPTSSDGVARWFQFAAPTFDPSLMEIFVTLSTGSTLCSASRDLILTNLESIVSELQASIMMATPSMAALLRRSKLTSLQSLWVMGETVLRKNIDDFARSTDQAETSELCNAYGPTEGSINCTLLPHFHPGDRGSIIGPALPTCSLFVLDTSSTRLNPVPKGFAGELAIGGPQVSIGYLNRPEQNAHAFVTSPQFGRLYLTGDKARIVTDRKGNHVLEFLGRLDTSQVKLSGRRVDLGEIDTIISSCPCIKEAVTVSYTRFADQPGSEEAVCFIVIDDFIEKKNAEVECRNSAARLLPSYMCPSKYFILSEMPRSMAGKIDRKSLKSKVACLWKDARTEEDVTQPTGSYEGSGANSGDDHLETLIKKLLRELVGSADIQIDSDTNLFTIGIDSLRAIRFLQLARDAGIIELGIADVLGGVTPAGLKDLVTERRRQKTDVISDAKQDAQIQLPWEDFMRTHIKSCSQILGIPIEFIENILPTTATQSGMLTSFLRSSGKNRNYIHHSVHQINRSINISKLQEAWICVLKRHESYRMVFVAMDDIVSPFGQCILDESCPLAKPTCKTKYLDTDNNKIIEKATHQVLRDAEDEIVLDRPSYQLNLIEAKDKIIITFSVFHAIFDGASLQLLFDEVSSTYYGNVAPRRTEIYTAVDMHYRSDPQKTIDFWSAQLKDCDPIPFPSLTGLRSEVVTKIPSTSSLLASMDIDSLKDGAKSCATSPLSILQAAWSLLLVTYKDSIHSSTFGSVISGRLHKDTEVCMGPTFTTIPITIPTGMLSSQSTKTLHVLHKLAEINAKSLSHLQIPLNSIVAPSGGLYYDTLLAFQDFATAASNSDLWSHVDYPAMGNDFAVMVEIWPESDGSIRLRATYTDEFLNDASATLMLQQFSDIIHFIIQHPENVFLDARFATTPSLAPQQLSTLELSESGDLLHTCFERNARLNPEDVALVFKKDLNCDNTAANIQWTYAELNQKADNLARYLISRYGTLEDKVIPFCLYKSPELYVAILGILKAGGAWCPIDPTFPASRRRDLIVRTEANMLLVANETVFQQAHAIPSEVSLVDLTGGSMINQCMKNDNDSTLPAIRSVSVAYLIWTSGTTGLPKGVQVQHSAAAAAMRSLRSLIPKSRSNELRCLQFSQPTFDVFVQDLFYTWGLRGTVIAAPKEIMLGSFTTLSNITQATHAHLTPAFATIVSRKHCESLEVVTMIGEALQQPVADDWGHNMLAFNTYGPAEVSVVSTVKQFGGVDNNFRSTNVGVPLPSVGAFIINDDRIIMKQGVGELALSGPQVARGYWKDQSKTDEKFHWNESCGSRIYMTGDIVRQLHNGSFEFVGRRDDLVKLNGMRVELSEISFALSNCHPLVEQVVTMHMARPDRPTKVLVVFLSVPGLKSNHIGAIGALLATDEHAVEIANAASIESKRTLPEHMIPSVFIVLNHIPVTASAKIDRKAISAAYEALDLGVWESKFLSSEASVWTEQEEQLLQQVAIFSGTSMESFKRMSRLATLGIDSIGAIRFTARLKSEGYKVSAADILRCQTVGDLCSLIAAPSSKSCCLDDSQKLLNVFHNAWFTKVAHCSVLGGERNFIVCPTLPLQDNLLSETFRNYESYWSNHFFELDVTIDTDTLKEAWLHVAGANEALRVGFLPTASIEYVEDVKVGATTFVQIIYNEPSVNWSRVVVNPDQFATKAKGRAQEIAREHQANSFIHPPWAVTIFDQGSVRTMMLSVHHSVHDGPSLQLIIEDLQDAYSAKGSPQHRRHQLREAVAISHMNKTSPQEDLVFWESTLSDFATDSDDSPQQANTVEQARSYHTKSIPLDVSTKSLQAVAQKLQCSSATSILRAAWGCIVSDFLETDQRVVIGEVLSERLVDSSLDDVIGPLVSLVPIPISTSGTAREVLIKQDSVNATAFKHRHANPGMLRKLIKRPKHQPLYPAVFVFHPHNAETDTKNDLWVEVEDFLGLNVEHDLTLNVEQRHNGSLDLEVSVEKRVLGIQGVDVLVKQLSALITAMISHPDIPIKDLTNFFPTELISITKQRHPEVDAVVAYDNPLCWFEHWAQVCPEWPAAEIADYITRGSSVTHIWTYSKLNKEANRVCSFIHSHGIHGRMIGMCLGRTLAAFAVTIGILKSGNTYLPIDRDLPIERKAFLLRDSNSAIFFTDEKTDFAPEGCMVIDVECDQYQLDEDKPLNIVRSKDSVAYLLYTSGSTGNPKGVLISCENLTSFCEAQSEYICQHAPATRELGGVGKYLGLASRAFDVHVGEMFLAWRHGISIVTGNKSMLLDDLPLALQELKVTHASFVPSLLDQVGLLPSDVPLLKYMGVGGEKISQRTLETWGDSDSVALINAYGPTEATIGCASARVSSKANMRNIGRPLGDTVAHVLIPGTLTYAKRGMEGELCLTGSLVGIGYHNRDTGAFVNDFHGTKMYRTGDLVRLMPDDSIEIFGRSDDQTKIRGQRLELGEVSECVRALCSPNTDVASLITKHPELSRMQLISFIASSKSTTKGEMVVFLDTFEELNTSVRNGCRERLPAYMVPDVVVPLNFLPLAAMSGKADMKQLKSVFAAIPLSKLLSVEKDHNSDNVPVSRELNENEFAVVEVLKMVLPENSADIGPFTNIFEVGVDSLIAISLSTRLRRAGFDCSVADILGIGTVEELALLAHSRDTPDRIAAGHDRVRRKLVEIESQFRHSNAGKQFELSVATVRPCLPVQEGVIARSSDKDSGALYVNHVVLELAKCVDVDELRQAWELCAMENDILRTCFCHVNNDILQVVLEKGSFKLSWKEQTLDPSNRIPTNVQAEVSRDIVENMQCVPPMRINLFLGNTPDAKPLLLVSMHHALYDAESLTILMADIYTRYQKLETPERPSSGSLVEYIVSLDTTVARDFWTNRLEGYNCPRPTNELANPLSESQTATRIMKTSLSSLESCAAKLHVTLPSLAQAVFGLAMAKASSVNDFVFGLVLSGRSVPIPNIEKLLAPTITTVPQRIDLRRSDSTMLQLLSSLQKSSGQLLQHQHTSLRAIHKWVQADRPLFDCLFSFIKTGEPSTDNKLWREVESYMPPDYPFAVEFEARHASNDLVLRAGYTSGFGSSSKVDNLLEMMELLIETVTKGNDISVKSLGIQASQNEISTSSGLLDENEEFVEERTIRDVLLGLAEFGSEQISRHSTFFRLGIDSVIAIRFAKELRNAGFAVSSSDIGRFPSIAALAKVIAGRNHKEAAEKENVCKPSNSLDQYRASIPLLSNEDRVAEVYACTPLQTGLLTQTVATGGQLYLHHPAVKLSSEIDIERMKKAWISVVENHDILRTTFHYTEGSEVPWIAAVHEKPIIQWVEQEASRWIDQSIENIVADTTFPTPESFSKPPLRATLLKSAFTSVLVVSIHHSLYDGWSLPLIFDALSTAYTDGPQKPSTSFFEAARLITDRQEKSVNFWLGPLRDYRSIVVPSSTSKVQDKTSFTKATIKMPTSEILQRCKSMNINLQSAALLAYGKALCCFVKRRDIVFGHVVSGRSLPLPDVERLVGPLFNTVPFRVKLDNPLLGNQDFVSQIQNTVVVGQEHQHASLQTIQKAWRQRNDGEDLALLDALFVFQKSDPSGDSTVNTLWTAMDMEDARDATEYGLNVEIDQGSEEVIISAASPAGRINVEDLEGICRNFDEILRDLLDSPQRSVTAYPEVFHDLPLEIAVVKKDVADYHDVAAAPILEVIRTALSEVAQIPEENITLHTSIFSLGLDSIAAIRVASICRRRSVQMSVADILQGHCLGGITRLLISKSAISPQNFQNHPLLTAQTKSQVLAQLKYPEVSVEEILPTVAGQEYHLASWLNSGRTFYEPTWAFQSREKIDSIRLATIWHELQLRHPILRTVFAAPIADQAYQIVLKPEAIAEPTFTAIQSTEKLVEAVKKDVHLTSAQPATLFTPPISLRLIQTDEGDAVLFRLHHALYDAWSMIALIRELESLYRNLSLPEIPDYGAFVKHTYRELEAARQQQMQYWKYSLKGAERTIISPSVSHVSPNACAASDQDMEEDENMTQTFVWIKNALPNHNFSDLTSLARKNSTSINTIMMLAFGRALARMTNQKNATFGFFQAGRGGSFEGVEKVLGGTVNCLPVCVAADAVQEKELVLERLQAIQRDMSHRVPYEQSRLKDVLSWVQEEGGDAQVSNPKAMFNASLNLLFHNPAEAISPDADSEILQNVDAKNDDRGEDVQKEKENLERLLKPMNIGVPTDFAQKRRIKGVSAVDALETGWLEKRALFVDVGVGEGDQIDFGVKVDRLLMSEEEVRAFVERVVVEVVGIMAVLGSED